MEEVLQTEDFVYSEKFLIKMSELVSSNWLVENLDDKNLILLDASLKTSADGKLSEYENLTIPKSRYFDLKNNFSDKTSSFPNTIPSEKQFELECQKLGVNQKSKIIVFDNRGIYSSPRVWWMFKVMGHQNISVLNGGLQDWISHGYPTIDRKKEQYTTGNFKITFKKEYIISYNDILNNLDTHTFTLIDARSEGRFNGVEKEPRVHLKSGCIPNSINIPYKKVLDGIKFKSEDKLKHIFNNQYKSPQKLVFSCGSGLTACITMLAYNIAFKNSDFRYIYDGSWTEWAELQNLKVL